MSNDYTLEEIRNAIDRSRESGRIESTPPLLYSIESVLDYLDRHYPGEHLGEEGEPITRLGFRETIEAVVWHAWWCDDDGGHIWEVNILLEEN